MKKEKIKLFLPTMCFASAVIFAVGFLVVLANAQQELTSFYGVNCCGSTNICTGTDDGCDNATCDTVGANCDTKTTHNTTTTCITGSSPGACNSGNPNYVCWEQYHCTCKDNTWPWADRCSNTGAFITDSKVTKKDCVI